MAGFSVLHYPPELAQIHVLWVSDAIFPSYPLLPPSPFAFNLSHHWGLFQWAGSSHQVAKVLELQLQKQPFQVIFKVDFLYDWLHLLEVQGTLKSLPQHNNLKASILLQLALFIVQLSCKYMTTGKTIPLTIWTFVGKVMSLLFNMLSRFVIAFLPYFHVFSHHHSDFGAQENKFCHYFHFISFYLPYSDGTGCHNLSFY